jgi:hypothetical protein
MIYWQKWNEINIFANKKVFQEGLKGKARRSRAMRAASQP